MTHKIICFIFTKKNMIYLNVILTILCVILISFLILALYLVKEYKNKIKNFPTQLNTDWNKNIPNFGNKAEIDNMAEMANKMIQELFKAKK